jgi:hypothetical protein
MTSKTLVDRISGFRWFRDEKIELSPDEVYAAGTITQEEICREVQPVEEDGQIGVESGISTYRFTPSVVSTGTATTPARLTSTSHNLRTGDVALVQGVVGLTGVNGLWPITRVSSTQISLDGSVGGGAWSSGGTITHCLSAATGLKGDPVLYSAAGVAQRRLDLRTLLEMQDNEQAFASSRNVLYYSLTPAKYLGLRLQGVPDAGYILKFTYYRKALAGDALSATVDPLLPDEVDQALYFGTLYYVLETFKSKPSINDRKAEVFQLYHERMKDALKKKIRAQGGIMASPYLKVS